MPPVYGLDATDVDKWNEQVRDVAFRVVDRFINNSDKVSGDDVIEPLPFANTSARETPTSFHCSVCDRVIIGERQWQEHLKSGRHHKVVKRANSSRRAVIRKPDC